VTTAIKKTIDDTSMTGPEMMRFHLGRMVVIAERMKNRCEGLLEQNKQEPVKNQATEETDAYENLSPSKKAELNSILSGALKNIRPEPN